MGAARYFRSWLLGVSDSGKKSDMRAKKKAVENNAPRPWVMYFCLQLAINPSSLRRHLLPQPSSFSSS